MFQYNYYCIIILTKNKEQYGRFVFQAVFAQIIEFLDKILLEDYTLIQFSPTRGLGNLCQKISLF
jgi:hypothetical protein